MAGERLTAAQRDMLSVFGDGRWHNVLSETFLGERPAATFFRAASIAVLGFVEVDHTADKSSGAVWARITSAGRRALEEAGDDRGGAP